MGPDLIWAHSSDDNSNPPAVRVMESNNRLDKSASAKAKEFLQAMKEAQTDSRTDEFSNISVDFLAFLDKEKAKARSQSDMQA